MLLTCDQVDTFSHSGVSTESGAAERMHLDGENPTPMAHHAETKYRHWVEPAMVCQTSDAMIHRHGERISSLPSAAAPDVTENCQEHHDEERPDTDRRPIRFVAIPRKGGQ